MIFYTYSAFFTNYDMIWIANRKDQLKHLKYILFEDRTLHNREARLVSGSSENLAILTRKGARAGITAGIITSVSKDTSLPVLCYREAEQLDTSRKRASIVLHPNGITSREIGKLHLTHECSPNWRGVEKRISLQVIKLKGNFFPFTSDEVEVAILVHESQTFVRETLEAILTSTKSTKMNRKGATTKAIPSKRVHLTCICINLVPFQQEYV
ncbi:hypothetical protein Y032_0017g3182 [Ancylostoma ceylanicum]|uniref:Uncharacterized protein n=1 Tax=Ancylostoma ceylanicum TaxID=53326 RepID=A0A016V3C4_9BILA|nr:hypothetical protein Y032_0017g3182 [Ancylostoma ceylanicum]